MSEHAVQAPTPLRSAYDPTKHLTRVNGNDYLPVAQRLAWLRAVYPDAVLTTDLVEILPDIAIFRAEVRIPSGGSATGYGSETPNDFKDYVEKAETKAIGRALAALGFGTQFCHDHEDGAPQRPVDGPMPIRQTQRAPQQRAQASHPPAPPQATPPPAVPEECAPAQVPNDPMSTNQRGYLERLAHERGMDLNALDGLAEQRFGVPYQWLGRQDASTLITYLQQIAVP